MPLETTTVKPKHYRCLGIGVGPANLSLACLMHGNVELPSLFLERRDTFGWHDGQQTPDAALQVSMLKDLVSLADPTNSFSFLAYLHAQGRIYHFLNARFDAVPRHEFRNYLEWAAHRNQNISFGEDVQAVEFDSCFRVTTNRRVVTADNLSIGVGNQAWLPPAAEPYLADPAVLSRERAHPPGRRPGWPSGGGDRWRTVRGRGVPRPDQPAGRPVAAPGQLDLAPGKLLPDR